MARRKLAYIIFLYSNLSLARFSNFHLHLLLTLNIVNRFLSNISHFQPHQNKFWRNPEKTNRWCGTVQTPFFSGPLHKATELGSVDSGVSLGAGAQGGAGVIYSTLLYGGIGELGKFSMRSGLDLASNNPDFQVLECRH